MRQDLEHIPYRSPYPQYNLSKTFNGVLSPLLLIKTNKKQSLITETVVMALWPILFFQGTEAYNVNRRSKQDPVD